MPDSSWFNELLDDALEAIRGRIEALLSPEVQIEIDLGLEAGDLDPSAKERLFLGLYTLESATKRLAEAGVLDALEQRVGGPVVVELDTEQGRLWLRKREEPEVPLAEVRARLTTHSSGRRREWDLVATKVLGWETEPVRPEMPAGAFLELDWMMLQNPFREVPADFRPLPGQRFPGLGMGREVIRTVRRAARRLDRSAVLATPMHFHNAVMYRKVFAFCDPVCEGLFLALTRDLAPLGFVDSAWAVEAGEVFVAGRDTPLVWPAHAMIDPISPAHRGYLQSPGYLELAAQVLERTRVVRK